MKKKEKRKKQGVPIYINLVVNLPHIDEILSKSYGVGISSDGDGTIGRSTLAFFAVADSYHSSRYLANLSDFGTTFADYTTNQFVWYCHLVRLIICRWLLSVSIVGAQLTAG